MKLSIVIPCYNAEKTIGEQVEALSKQRWNHPWEVIVADNGSSDGSMEVVKVFERKIDNLITLDAGKIKGPSYARNLGVKHSNGEYIAFVDADDVVGENWLRSIGEALLNHDFVACRADWTKLNNLNDYTLRAKPLTDGLINFGLVSFLPFANGGALGIKKSLHNKVGGFDESLRCSEDLDYCWRVQLEGQTLIFIPEALIYMRARDTNHEVFKQYIKWEESLVYMYEKYKHHGLADYTIKQSIRSLSHVIRRWRDYLSPEKKDLWIIRLAQQLGRLKGMIKYKYLKVGLLNRTLEKRIYKKNH